MLKFVKQLTDFQYHRVSFAKCTQLERSPGISYFLSKALIISFKAILGSLSRVAELNLIKSALKLSLICTFLSQAKLCTAYTAGAT